MKYRDIVEKYNEIREENRILKERMAYIASATNLLLPLPHQNTGPGPSNMTAIPQKYSPPILEQQIRKPQTPENVRKPPSPEVKPVLEFLETSFQEEKPMYNQAESQHIQMTHQSLPIIASKIPHFTTDPRYPSITREFLMDCHQEAETAQQAERSKNVTKETEFRDRVFVRLIFNKLFHLSELVGRSATGAPSRVYKGMRSPEIDVEKKKFIRDRLKERLIAVDPIPKNITARTNNAIINKWYGRFIVNRLLVSTKKKKEAMMIKQEMSIGNSSNSSLNQSGMGFEEDTVYEIDDDDDDDITNYEIQDLGFADEHIKLEDCQKYVQYFG